MTQIKKCPRSGNYFECKVDDITNCDCNIPLDNATREFLSKTNFDCLSVDSLQYFDVMVKESKKHRFPSRTEPLIEGFHYYIENGYWVFTEMYHLLRGFCCKSGCRHCVYGFKKEIK